MERLPEWAKAACGVIAFLFLPSIGFVYSQGEAAKAKEHLALTNTELVQSVKELTTEISNLSAKLTAETVKIDYSEKRLDKLEQVVTANSQKIAILRGHTDG